MHSEKDRIKFYTGRRNEFYNLCKRGIFCGFRAFFGRWDSSRENGEILFLNLTCEGIEYTGKVQSCLVNGFEGVLEMDSNLDMEIELKDFSDSFELNQVGATSEIKVPNDFSFESRRKGIKTYVSYKKNGMESEDFSDGESENIIEFNGMRSELIISREG